MYPADELEEGGGVLGYTVVRPGSQLELFDLPAVSVPHLHQRKIKYGQKEKVKTRKRIFLLELIANIRQVIIYLNIC